MKVVIDIPEDDYKLACNYPDALIACYAHYIKAGVPLPKKHGRLIDADAFKSEYGMKNDCADCEKEMHGKVKACEYDRIYSKMDFCGWLDDVPTVIEAEVVE